MIRKKTRFISNKYFVAIRHKRQKTQLMPSTYQ